MKYDAHFPMPLIGSFRLEEASIDEIQCAMEAGQVTSVQLVHAYFQRAVLTHDYLHAVMQFNPEMFHLAERSDAERRAGVVHGPLHGIPFMVKDNIAVAEAMETTAGSYALLGSKPLRNAFIVDKLVQAGAVLIGKTNMSEWANSRSESSSQGYSARGGQTRSPYNQEYCPGGSSSGSAVGVAANLMTFSIGTETDASLVEPAAWNQVVVIKPTVGLTSRSGVIPLSLNYDTVGPFGKTVRDAAHVLDAMVGIDPRDPCTLAQQGKTPPKTSYASFVTTKEALKDAVFGIPWESIWAKVADKKYVQDLLAMVKLLEQAGAKVVMGTELRYPAHAKDKVWGNEPDDYQVHVYATDFYNDIKTYLAECENTPIQSIEDIIDYNKKYAAVEGGLPGIHPAFESGQDWLEYIASLQGHRDEKYWHYLKTSREVCRNAIDNALTTVDDDDANEDKEKKKLSGLLYPGLYFRGTHQITPSGYPIINVPMGFNEEKQSGNGLAIVQTAFHEGELIKWASAIEDLMKSLPDCPYTRSAPTWTNLGHQNLPAPF